MKYTRLLAVTLAVAAGSAYAIDLNTDALKKMQNEGNRILEEEKAAKSANSDLSFKQGNQCLQMAGANVVRRQCNDKAKNQKWNFDDQGRLVGAGGTCVSIAANGSKAVLQKCSGAAVQKWQLDGSKRLKNANNQCLESKGGQVMAADCGNDATQKWG